MSGKVLIPETASAWHAPGQMFTTIKKSNKPTSSLFLALAFCFTLVSASFWAYADIFGLSSSRSLHRGQANRFQVTTQFKKNVLSQCAAFRTIPGPPADFYSRDESDRFEPGTNATLIRNALIFTGRDNGTDVVRGDILLDKGIIRSIGEIADSLIKATPNLTVVDAKGAWVTPGLVDLHTHLGVMSLPVLAGAFDLNSRRGPVAPWLRSVDGLNTHDESYQMAIAGGVTTVQVLPGSGNAIGGQAFLIKLRQTKDRSTSSMLLEPPYSLIPDNDDVKRNTDTRWRHMKQACGENLLGYGFTRMDTIWSYREAYAEALKIKLAQDEYCEKAENGLWDALDGPMPQNLQWEVLVEVLRGKVKVSTHCYEAVDLDAMVRLTNEFQFHIDSFHHAAEAYLVPSTLKNMWGGPPSVAVFATQYRFKREAFRGSEFAPRILADEGIPVIMKSDHPVINSRHLVYQAQQAHYFGLAPGLALASITSTPAGAAGVDHRVGMIQEGYDADIVIWDSHPLQLGATPVKVWIDGILQIPAPPKGNEESHPVVVGKGKEGEEWKEVPQTPNWDAERNLTLAWDGLPPLEGKQVDGTVLFTNVKNVWKRSESGSVVKAFSSDWSTGGSTVVVDQGRVTCMGDCVSAHEDAMTIDLEGGSIAPGLMTFGAPIGLEEIASEPSTADGATFDAFRGNLPEIMGDNGGVLRAMDALVFQTRNALTAYRAGVTFATTSFAQPLYLAGPGAHVISGLSVTFRTGAAHSMQRGAVIQDVAALHVVLGRSNPIILGSVSVSTQIAGLRRLLYGFESRDEETGAWFRKASEGIIPLVIEVDSADIMANLLIMKADVEDRIGSRMRMVFAGAMEAHLLAEEISNAHVGVILNPIRSMPMVWDQRRILPGPPLSNDTALVTLLDKGVVVGLGIREGWEARNTRFDVQWAVLESNERISEEQAYDLVTTNLEDLLGIRSMEEEMGDLVAFRGGSMFDQSSKAVGVISGTRELVDLF